MNKLAHALAIAIAILTPAMAHAQAPEALASTPAEPEVGTDYCERRLGQWFYCEVPVAPKPKPRAKGTAKRDDAPAKHPDLVAAEQFKKDMEEARLIAVWNPSAENIQRYYAYQQMVLEKGGTFADTWRRMVWENPDKDYTLQRPINTAGKAEWLQARNTDRDLFFRAAYDQIGIFYVYRGDCGPCRVASPIVRAFATRYGISVRAISADGGANPHFPDAQIDKGQLKAWGLTSAVTPAYMIFQKPTTTGKDGIKPVSFRVTDGKTITLRPCRNPKGCLTYMGAGVLSVDELADRLFVTLATEPGKDF
ncbi:conjugal transfer protein TraF [Asticcacaulis excentricus]|uniref:TraF-like protein n=1 Tax=Asticcacaulis excentricus (strain ATCC 15261 / DSM 4724 / KCTC 12464 / NCIMB 9791 / VKM B-1370 / CB 48) TaxID=573065 RepID=E8RVY5_ASTEC|nr:conjugal transfer protein TraF [Asticcacaulis excentricus]ADU15407.1 TraF-like protein [Asticcacaulis excentricus CB 48]